MRIHYTLGWNDLRKRERNSYFRAGFLCGMGAIVIVVQVAEWIFLRS